MVRDNKHFADEFLSGLRKEDRLHPVFTIVLYYGEKPWDGPRKLSDMVALGQEWKLFFEDYSMRLIEVVDGEVLSFQDEENRLLFEMIKDVNKLSKKELLEKYKQEAIPKSVAVAVGEMTGTKALIWHCRKRGMWLCAVIWIGYLQKREQKEEWKADRHCRRKLFVRCSEEVWTEK